MIWLILILGLILRVVNLNQSLWLDEGAQVLLSRGSLYSIIFQRGVDVHPPLSYILMHFWLFFGTSEIWLRLLSVIFGVLTIWIVYKFSSKIFNKKIAMLAALFLSISPYHIYYSQEIRMYAEATFFAVVSMYYFFLLIRERKKIDSFIYILSSAALIYTHYVGFFLILTQFVYLLLLKRDLSVYFLKRLFLVFLLWLPWMPQFFIQLKGAMSLTDYLPGWKSTLSISFYKVIPLTFFKFSFGRINFDNLTLYIFIAVFVLLIFGYILYKGIKVCDTTHSKLIIFWLLVPIVSVLIISFKTPLDQPFRVLYVVPAYCILLALGIDNLTKFKKIFFVSMITLSFLGLSLYFFNPKYWREDWRGASKFISEKNNQNTITIFAWPEPFPSYQFYARDSSAIGIIKNFPVTINELENTLTVLDNKREVYLFEYLQALSDPNKYIQVVLNEKGFKENKVYDFRGVGFIYHYVKNE